MSTTEEVDESLAIQIKRHELLKAIIKQLDELGKTDEAGPEWILEQLAEG